MSQPPPEKKLLLMGRAAAGKTSIRSIIFANYVARETSRLHPTNQVENCSLRLLGSLALSLWDCGGQDLFMENYFESQRDHIFKNVQTLIYVLGAVPGTVGTGISLSKVLMSKNQTKSEGGSSGNKETGTGGGGTVAATSPQTTGTTATTDSSTVSDQQKTDGPANNNTTSSDPTPPEEIDSISKLPMTLQPQFQELQKDLSYFKSTVESLRTLSADAQIFVFVHKMDLVPDYQRDELFQEYKNLIHGIVGQNAAQSARLHLFATSIWDETLFKAWSAIVYSLIPNVETLERHLDHFLSISEVDEVVLFEKNTFVVISAATSSHQGNPVSPALRDFKKKMQEQNQNANSQNQLFKVKSELTDSGPLTSPTTIENIDDDGADVHRFEKISNLIKQFKLSITKSNTTMRGMQVGNSQFTAFVERFTENTFIMIIASNQINSGMLMANIKVARRHFSQLASKVGAHL